MSTHLTESLHLWRDVIVFLCVRIQALLTSLDPVRCHKLRGQKQQGEWPKLAEQLALKPSPGEVAAGPGPLCTFKGAQFTADFIRQTIFALLLLLSSFS